MSVITTHPFKLTKNGVDFYSKTKYYARVEYATLPDIDFEEQKDIINIVTHNHRFHADEIVGIALLKAFLTRYTDVKQINVIRVPHSNNREELHNHLKELGVPHYSYVLDTGREFNGVVYFDHHQEDAKTMKNPKATAGKILEAIIDWELNLFSYDVRTVVTTSIFTSPEFSSLARLVDENDLGISPAGVHTIPFIIANSQSLGFNKVLELIENYIESIITAKTGKQQLVKNILEHTRYITGTKFRMQYDDSINDIEFDSWNRLVNQTDFDEPIHGILTYSRSSKKWKLHTMSASDGSYAKSGPSLPQDSDIDFIHTAGFIATDTDKESLLCYIQKHFTTI